jgi:hypothetical protein
VALPEVPPEFTGSIGVYDEAQKMLDYLVQAATESMAPIPARQYVTVGQAVEDCEQVVSTIFFARTGVPDSLSPGPQSFINCPPMWREIVDLSIHRCVPVMSDSGIPPTPEALEQAAKVEAMDTYLLQKAAEFRSMEGFGAVTCIVTYPPHSGGFGQTQARYEVAVST